MKTSELLRFAANEFLWDGTGRMGHGKQEFSCLATAAACRHFNEDRWLVDYTAEEFVRDYLTKNEAKGSFPDKLLRDPVTDFLDPEDEQAMRFTWLHLMALVAEDQGN